MTKKRNTKDQDCIFCQITDVLIKTLRREFEQRNGAITREDVSAALARTFVMLLSEVAEGQIPYVVAQFTDYIVQDLIEAYGVNLDDVLEREAAEPPRAVNGHTVH